MKGERGADWIRLDAEDDNEREILKGLFETVRDADDCVVISRQTDEIRVYGGAFSGDIRGQLRDLLGVLLGELYEGKVINARSRYAH